ncbi:HpcH/HpaI aldolase family protein [Salipiger sp.]|uniref:HpcH/HpaI aldolase family protein n=1 Tax=Salipiger sp. TaxID=2078585 RepID=UPI003A9767E7
MSGHPLRRSRTKALLDDGELALGLIVRVVRSAEIVPIALQSGHDFLFLDAQHAVFDPQAVGNIAVAANVAGITPLVRVRGFDDPMIPIWLDAGAGGVIVPDIASAGQARRVVDACRYPPVGKRSFAGPCLALGYEAMPPAAASEALNGETLVICMIETTEGLANVEEIAAVDGVDVLHIGCNDLLMAMGRPGDFACDEIAGAVRQVIAACKGHGKIAGFGGDRDRERQRRYIGEGVCFVTTQADVALLLAAASTRAGELR